MNYPRLPRDVSRARPRDHPRCSPSDIRGSSAEQTCPLTSPWIFFMGYRATSSSWLPREKKRVTPIVEPTIYCWAA